MCHCLITCNLPPVVARHVAQAGTLLAGVGSHGASNVSSLNFTVADQNSLNDQARSKAITDAQAKAKVLASQLGVSLVRVTSFNENGSTNAPQPLYAMADAKSAGAEAAAPTIAPGQNTILSNVSVTYEIR